MFIVGILTGLLFALCVVVTTVYRAMPLGKINKTQLVREALGGFLVGYFLIIIISGAMEK